MYTLAVTVGGSLQGTPGLRLPLGSIKARLTDGAGQAVVAAPVALHVLEGGAFFPAGAGPNRNPASQLVVSTDAAGDVTVPELQLGHELCCNRLLLQADHAAAQVSVVASYAQTQLVCVTPAGGALDGLCRETVGFELRVVDQGFP